ncbi:hypothetical protein Leryth_024255 [Lithospermum erythrorhizon]|nr:hypothetical protein Leryth_024255 [Lithospermum erythrorhizon]
MEAKVMVKRRKLPTSCLVASVSKDVAHRTVRCITSMKKGIQSTGVPGDVIVFLATTAALEILRRFSKNNCPFIWRGLQLLQALCYPPFKWLNKWPIFKDLQTNVQKLSRPMLFLSIATVFSDEFSCDPEASDNFNHSQAQPESQSDTSSNSQNPDTRYNSDINGTHASDKWLVDLTTELNKEGIIVPERLGKDELRRFYDAVNADFSRLLSSVRRTIRWRQTYTIFSPEELQAWSRLIYWHGCDVNLRHCLIIRLGLACSNLRSDEMHLLVKAIVSQIEHGIVNLNESDHPQISVLMDCDGLSPFGFPVHMMRSCAMLLQDHYPNRLGCLAIIRLPQIARVVTQTLFQVLKPATRKKLKTIGRNYEEFLSNFLPSAPSFLGGCCRCSKCSDSEDLQVADDEISENPNRDLAEISYVDRTVETDGRLGNDKDVSVKLVFIFTLISLLILIVIGKCV